MLGKTLLNGQMRTFPFLRTSIIVDRPLFPVRCVVVTVPAKSSMTHPACSELHKLIEHNEFESQFQNVTEALKGLGYANYLVDYQGKAIVEV